MSETESTPDAKRAIEAFHSYKSKSSSDTAREYRRHINRFNEYVTEHTEETLWTVHSGHVEDFFAWMLNDLEYSPSSVRVAQASLGSFYQQIKEFGEEGRSGIHTVPFDTDPTEYASAERLEGMHSSSQKEVEGGDRPLSRSEVKSLVEDVPPPTVRNELIVRMLYQTGMRRSELVRVKLRHIDTDNRKIAVYGKKTDKKRDVWYQPNLDEYLSMWIDADRNAVFYADESEYLFPTRRAEYMSEQTVTDVVTTAAENAGIQETVYTNRGGQEVHRVGAHTLRKSFGVHFINDGGDISLLADLLGHEDIETTKDHYLKYSDKDLENSMRRHGPTID